MLVNIAGILNIALFLSLVIDSAMLLAQRSVFKEKQFYYMLCDPK